MNSQADQPSARTSGLTLDPMFPYFKHGGRNFKVYFRPPHIFFGGGTVGTCRGGERGPRRGEACDETAQQTAVSFD
jgi:hypothetical protein